MRTRNTVIDGCFIIQDEAHEDPRGLLIEAFRADAFYPADFPRSWPQNNLSFSYPGVIRGLHTQHDNPSGKLVRCLSGEVRDVCVDVRPKSPTFRKVQTVDLSDPTISFYIPAGCLHGFSVISKECPATLLYLQTSLYDKGSQFGVAYDDPLLNIDWGVDKPIVSKKDKNFPKLADYLNSLS